MSTNQSGTVRTFTAGAAALNAYEHVKLSSGLVVVAGAGEAGIGYTLQACAAGAAVAVQIFRPTVLATAAGGFSAGASLYSAANGRVDDVANGNVIGIALEAATAAGDVVEILPNVPHYAASITNTVVPRTTNLTLTDGDSDKIYTTTGASGTVVFTLPASTASGVRFLFYVGAAQELRIDPNGSETIALPSTGVQGAAGKYLTADAVGEWVEVRSLVAGGWAVTGFAGTWTAES